MSTNTLLVAKELSKNSMISFDQPFIGWIDKVVPGQSKLHWKLSVFKAHNLARFPTGEPKFSASTLQKSLSAPALVVEEDVTINLTEQQRKVINEPKK